MAGRAADLPTRMAAAAAVPVAAPVPSASAAFWHQVDLYQTREVAGFRRIVRIASGGRPTRSSCMYIQGASLPLPSTLRKPKLLSWRWKLEKLLCRKYTDIFRSKATGRGCILPPVQEMRSGASSPTMVRSLTRKSGGGSRRSIVPDILVVGRECRRLGEGLLGAAQALRPAILFADGAIRH